ncbi:hypothetical protein DRO19_00035 [Candidatus Bathyarchaeota archaeon]|nr:MAG: hypothetical protein DRO19_00035 [Candidatus Bathyarchaeota archaeon]
MSYTPDNNNVKESLNNLNNLNNEYRKCYTFYLRVGQMELFKDNVRKYTRLSLSQAIDMLIERFNQECEERKQQPTLIQFIKAEPHSTVLIQNKVSAPKCHFCENIAVTTAIFAPTNREYPVCSRHAEELKNHPKWRLLNEK